MDFFEKNSATLTNIKDWNIYRRATEVGVEPIITTKKKIKDKNLEVEAYNLLLNGKINVFNKRKKKEIFSI